MSTASAMRSKVDCAKTRAAMMWVNAARVRATSSADSRVSTDTSSSRM
jgi:hypothetical protein